MRSLIFISSLKNKFQIMKSFLLFILLPLFALKSIAQDSLVAPFKKDPNMPAFNILQTDSTWFGKNDLPKDKPVVIVYFSPDCGHCQLTAHEFEEKMDQFKDVEFVWISFLSIDKIKSFADEYKLSHYENVRVGRDPKYFVPSFFQVKVTPFMAVYSKKGRLIQTFVGGTDPDTIMRVLGLSKS